MIGYVIGICGLDLALSCFLVFLEGFFWSVRRADCRGGGMTLGADVINKIF